MNTRGWALALFLFQTPASPRPAIASTVKFERLEPGGWVLKVAVTNRSAGSVSIAHDSIPWETRDAIILVAVTADYRQAVLEQSHAIEDPAPGSLDIGAGETIRGTIRLERRFPTLQATLRDRSVIVFWSFKLEMSAGGALDRANGAVVLPPAGSKRALQ